MGKSTEGSGGRSSWHSAGCGPVHWVQLASAVQASTVPGTKGGALDAAAAGVDEAAGAIVLAEGIEEGVEPAGVQLASARRKKEPKSLMRNLVPWAFAPPDKAAARGGPGSKHMGPGREAIREPFAR